MWPDTEHTVVVGEYAAVIDCQVEIVNQCIIVDADRYQTDRCPTDVIHTSKPTREDFWSKREVALVENHSKFL